MSGCATDDGTDYSPICTWISVFFRTLATHRCTKTVPQKRCVEPRAQPGLLKLVGRCSVIFCLFEVASLEGGRNVLLCGNSEAGLIRHSVLQHIQKNKPDDLLAGRFRMT